MDFSGSIPGPSALTEDTPPIQIFGPDSNAFSAPYTQKLLQSIREHLCRTNSNTRAQYESAVKTFCRHPPLVVGDYPQAQPEPDDSGSEPDYAIIKSYFSNAFPNVQLQDWESDTKEGRPVLWGAVLKEDNNQHNTILLRESVVCALEGGDEKTRSQLSFILLVIVIHELSRALMKKYLGGKATSSSNGRDQHAARMPSEERYRESGIFMEQQLLGFRLFVEWKKSDHGEMDKICRLIARGEDGGTRILTWNDAAKITDSLGTDTLHKLDFQKLEPAPELCQCIRVASTRRASRDSIAPSATPPPEDGSDRIVRMRVPFDDSPTALWSRDVNSDIRFRRHTGPTIKVEQHDDLLVREPVTGGDVSVHYQKRRHPLY